MLRFLRNKGAEETNRAADKTRRAWFGRIATLFHGPSLNEQLWEELEELLVSADVGMSTTQILLERTKETVRSRGLSQPGEALRALKEEMVEILDLGRETHLMEAPGRPLILLIVGVNGAGKTTSIAKLARLYQESGRMVVLGAADTFRAAATEQLQFWGQQLGADVIAHQPGADPGAVAFDALQAAKARGADVVIIDTAGRIHTKVNLMEELKKVHRVLSKKDSADSQRVLVTLDATTGQNGLLQAKAFTNALECHGVFLAKLDGSAKGGVVLAVSNELELPVLFIGTGEGIDDVSAFDPRQFVEALFAGDE